MKPIMIEIPSFELPLWFLIVGGILLSYFLAWAYIKSQPTSRFSIRTTYGEYSDLRVVAWLLWPIFLPAFLLFPREDKQ